MLFKINCKLSISPSTSQEQLLLAAQNEALREHRAQAATEPKENPVKDEVEDGAEGGEEEAQEEDCAVDDKDVD